MPEIAHTLCIIGPQPPPRHGVSAVNEAMGEAARISGLLPVCLNTAPDSLARSFFTRAARIRRIWRAIRSVRHYARQRSGPVYISLSGGLGLVWEALLAWQARCAGVEIIVHHHSFRYLDRPYAPMRLLVWAVGRDALHVVLGSTMGRSLQQRYAGVRDIIVLSNADFVGLPISQAEFRAVAAPRIVGLLANLSADKGLDDFLRLSEASQVRGLPWRFILAGPFEDRRDHKRIMPRINALPNLDYRGPLYGEAKNAFLQEIDIFVFPTRYRHEAEPLVLLEALRYGRPVIAYARGCIAEMLDGGGGSAIPVEAEFVEAALIILEAWRGEGPAFRSRSEVAHQRFTELWTNSAQTIQRLFARFGGSKHD